MTQFDIFGNEIDVKDIPPAKHKGGRGKTATMQETYGTIEGKYCKNCKHCFSFRQSRTWYKCNLWLAFFETGNSQASDIRLKWTACKKYEEETDET